MATANPALSESAFESERERSAASGSDAVMTIDGTVGKAFILLALVMAAGMWTWNLFITSKSPDAVMPYLVGGSIGGFIVAIVTIFKHTLSPFTAPLYAILEGLALGGLSAIFEAQYPGIAIHAFGFSVCICAAMLMLYTTRVIKATQNFIMGVAAATLGVGLFYLVTIILGFFHIQVPMIYDSGPIGIAFSLFVVVLAALNLVIDFNVIEVGAQTGAPKYMEWYGAFGLMVTLVWLYLEVLRLLAKLRGRER